MFRELPHLEPGLDVCGHLHLSEAPRADGVVELVEAIQDGVPRVLGSLRHLKLIYVLSCCHSQAQSRPENLN